jgi:hypothetical protein
MLAPSGPPRSETDDEQVCHNCGYSLAGLRDRKCPECGRWIADLVPRLGFRSRVARPHVICNVVSTLLLTIILILIATMPNGSNSSSRDPWRAWSVAVGVAALPNFVLAVFARDIQKSGPASISVGIATILFALVVLLSAWLSFPIF